MFGSNKATKLICPKCKSENVTAQIVTNTKTQNRGCVGSIFWIILALCTFGLALLLIPLLTGGGKTSSENKTVAVCQNCGNTWEVKQ